VGARHGRRREIGTEPEETPPVTEAPSFPSIFVSFVCVLCLIRSRCTVCLGRSPEDGELVELLWQDGAVVAHYHREVGGNTGASGVTGEAASAWSREAGALGGDMYEQLWHDIAQLEGRVDGGTAASAWPPASSGAGSSRTGGEVGSSFCGSNLVAPALRVGDGAALPLPAGASTSGGTGSSAPLKRSRDELDGSRSEVAFSTLCWCQLVKLCFDSVGEEGRNLQGAAGFEAVDETRPASSKRRTRAAEVHNLSERVSRSVSERTFLAPLASGVVGWQMCVLDSV
jgi:phytochrome-interacting factor 4